jgi:hypothetical protein
VKRIKQLSNGMGNDISFDQSEIKDFQYYICKFRKTHRRSIHNISMERVEWPGQFFHTDVCEPMQVPSYGGSQYLLIIVDDTSCKPTPYFLKLKSDAKEIIKTFIKRVNNNHPMEEKRV